MSGGVSYGGAGSPGAGRTIDLVWPGINQPWPINGTNVTNATISYGRPNAQVVGNHATTIGGTGAIRAATGTGWNNRGGVQYFPGAAGFARSQFDPMTVNFAHGSKAVQGYDEDPFACYRFAAVLSFGANNGAGESGAVMATANIGDNRIRDAGASGFGFIQTGAGEVSFIRRAGIGGGGGALTTTPILQTDAAGILNWHLYELRFISATPTANAKLKAFLDRRQINLGGVNGPTLDWVDDGLALPQDSAGNYGFKASVYSYGAAAAATGLIVHRLFFHAAPNENALL